MRENETCRQKDLKKIPSERLDALLQDELRKETPDAEVVLPILEELEFRDKDNPIEVTENISAAWERFKEQTAPVRKRPGNHRWISVVAAAAAVVLLVTAVMPTVAGTPSIFDVLFRWSESLFEFFDPEQTESAPQVDEGFVTENPGLQQVYDIVTEFGVTYPIVPMWLPEGYMLTELKESTTPDGTKVRVFFQKEDSVVTLSYKISSDIISWQYEKENTAVDVYEYADVSHFIMENDDKLSVTWIVDGAECSMVADSTRETLYRVIKSIYRREIV